MQQKPTKQFEKQRALKSCKIEQEYFINYECQPILGQHDVCNDECLTFVQTTSNQQCINNIRIEKLKASSLIHSKTILKQFIICQQQYRVTMQNEPLNKKQKKQIRKVKNPSLTQDQRELIEKLQYEGFKNSVISGILGVSTSQVRQNQIRLKICKSKEEINITKRQQLWLKEHGSSQSSSILFNAQKFLSAFLVQFPKSKLSITQFRQVLRQCNMRYRIPSLKPFSFFNKTGKDEETKSFISKICSYLAKEYKFVFIDECSLGNISKSSHKQWHVLGSFKESTQRISSFKYLIGSLGDDYFLQYQIISGTGKAYIFQDFIIQIIKKAQEHYKDKQFVLIMDNCSIHKSKQIEQILDRVPCIFTPVYRPEFNAIEHMFGWLKRGLVAAQTTSTSQLIYQIHRIINSISQQFITNWCQSIYKPMLKELDYL